MAARAALRVFAILVLCNAAHIFAADEDPLQDFCVASQNVSGTSVNGLTCKPAGEVVSTDFVSTRLRNPAAFNRFGSAVNGLNVQTFAGLNTLGISLARIDFTAGGINPPHTHPRATEVLYLMSGTLNVGFISANNTLYSATLYAGDVFIFPRGLIHFQENVGRSSATAIAALSSQFPGAQQVAPALFGSKPPVASHVLQLAFNIPAHLVAKLQANFTT